MDEKDFATIPLAYHETCMQREKREKLYIIVAWATSLVLVVGLFVFLWLQYDYECTTEQSGIYNLVDSQGNVVSSDLTAEQIEQLLKEIQSGPNQTNPKAGT